MENKWTDIEVWSFVQKSHKIIRQIEKNPYQLKSYRFTETSYDQYFQHKRMIIGEFHVAIKKQIINSWNKNSFYNIAQ